MILTPKKHKFVLSPQTSSMFKTDTNKIGNIIFEKYESRIIQDQAFFIWLLFTVLKRKFCMFYVVSMRMKFGTRCISISIRRWKIWYINWDLNWKLQRNQVIQSINMWCKLEQPLTLIFPLVFEFRNGIKLM